jgi:hypothetical protein
MFSTVRRPKLQCDYALKAYGKLQPENLTNWTLYCHLMNCAYLLATDWKLYLEIDKDSTVYALMTNTEFVSDGQRRDRLMLKSQIIIKKF